MHRTLRCLYVCYLSLDDPLVQTQVVAYLDGLTRRGHLIHLLTFEPGLPAERRNALERDLERRGITWHVRRYHKRPTLLATLFDVLVGSFAGARLVRRHGLEAVHARSHVPAAMALCIRGVLRCRLIFDIRGLMAEEYVDAGRWRRGGLAYRLTSRIQAAAIRRADGIVVLTDRVREYLFGGEPRERTYVIPCCTDVERIAATTTPAPEVVDRVGDRPTLVYVGKLGPRYMEREMAEFFAVARTERVDLFFLVLTQSEPDRLTAELESAGVTASDYLVTRADPTELGAYLCATTFAIYFYRPRFSEIAASPTKAAEYLAAGLPIVSGPDVGDIDALLRDSETGVVVDEFTAAGYAEAAERVLALVAGQGTRERCRSLAQDRFSLEGVGIPLYDELYRAVADLS
jgi:glycosyltransferase involved in cell wall biosynthesis